MKKKTYILANLVYGQLYPQLWLENQVKSLCDPTNLPRLKEEGYELEYCLFTDEETLQAISRHPNFMALSQYCTVHIVKMNWPPDIDKFASRYSLLVDMFHKILPVALEKDAYLSVLVADLVFAKFALPRMIKRLEAGHDAVFMVPIRSAADSVNPLLQRLPHAPTDLELFEMAYRNLHHLWVASHWDAPMFSKFPYSIVWNSGSGLCTHHFGITPIIFKPTEAMKNVRGVIDGDVPGFCKNPFWATDWIDAPVAGVEPLSNGHYPPFLQHKANIDFVVSWSKEGTMPEQIKNLNHTLYYPSKQIFNSDKIMTDAALVIDQILERNFQENKSGAV